MSEPLVIAALYKFATLEDFESLRGPLLEVCLKHGIKGTFLLAGEGINGTVSGSRPGIDAVLAHLRSDPRLADLSAKFSQAEVCPFYRMKVRLKQEIVSIGDPAANPNVRVGEYVEPEDWNALIADPEVMVIDTRNDYEVSTGTFKHAVDPGLKSFREFPAYARTHLDPAKHQKVAMFCTGGIRCEKASSYLLAHDFQHVYHLKGGILNYLEQVPERDSLWEGECFVFDQRVAVDHQLKPGGFEQCHACRHPLSKEDTDSPWYVPGESCPHCHDERTPEQTAAARERQKQMELAERDGRRHLGS